MAGVNRDAEKLTVLQSQCQRVFSAVAQVEARRQPIPEPLRAELLRLGVLLRKFELQPFRAL